MVISNVICFFRGFHVNTMNKIYQKPNNQMSNLDNIHALNDTMKKLYNIQYDLIIKSDDVPI